MNKKRTINGLLWSGIDRFAVQGVQFLINLVLARILLPGDFGIVAILSVFLQISQACIDSGFSNALIQKKNRTELDYSTVFYFNVVLGLFFYVIMFCSAPFISDFYKIEELTILTRVLSLNFLISSCCIIHKVKFTIELNFKVQAKISLVSIITSGIIGLILAFYGFGVWALICQIISNSFSQVILFNWYLRWKPLLKFSRVSFKNLFSFGHKLLFAGLIHSVYSNLYALVIGKKFSTQDLGYFTRAEQFAQFPSSNINFIISRVTFPIMVEYQDDNNKLAMLYRKYISVSSFIIFPMMVLLMCISEPLILLLLTNKWIGITVLLQLLCLDWMLDHLSQINLNVLFVKGRSDLALKLEVVKKIIAICLLFFSIPFGLVGICCGRVIYSIIATFLNSYYTNFLIGLNFKKQMSDFLPTLLLSLLTGAVVYFSIDLFENVWMQIFGGFILYSLIYLLLCYFCKIKSLFFLFNVIKNEIN